MLLVLNLLISKYISHQHKILISLKQEHINSLFRTLWWYPISLRVNAKVLTMVWKSCWISLNPHPHSYPLSLPPLTTIFFLLILLQQHWTLWCFLMPPYSICRFSHIGYFPLRLPSSIHSNITLSVSSFLITYISNNPYALIFLQSTCLYYIASC